MSLSPGSSWCCRPSTKPPDSSTTTLPQYSMIDSPRSSSTGSGVANLSGYTGSGTGGLGVGTPGRRYGDGRKETLNPQHHTLSDGGEGMRVRLDERSELAPTSAIAGKPQPRTETGGKPRISNNGRACVRVLRWRNDMKSSLGANSKPKGSRTASQLDGHSDSTISLTMSHHVHSVCGPGDTIRTHESILLALVL
ncbi:uncharacterized protein K452DRAFT_11741 [Aplosporella prunicola CBS 121167]|uniref:Uncharacterized protein n=1 Tax=Aplosporella prunicola CBS 121167 TaxID=1176127 RepID=A0A6A6BFA1_9PEZI|nr:uncharacterized protein K452DRAFT_11741 [Aplosporella prunicola CBS 121167]KAF2142850.1 hypothetical protein K452DRAFT_11741 [Aplosporella prunicola CBS 121167]